MLVRLSACCPDAAWPDLERRIEMELSLSGISMSRVDSSGVEMSSEQLDVMMAEHSAVGSIVVTVDTENGVIGALRFRDPTTETTTHRTLFLCETPSREAVELMAIKVQEAVLAVLYQERQGSPLRKPSVADRPVEDRAVEKGTSAPSAPSKAAHGGVPMSEKKCRLRLQTDFGVSWSPGGLGPLGMLGGGVAVLLTSWAFGAEAAYSLLAKDVRTDTASASFRLLLARVFAAFVLPSVGILQSMTGLRIGAGHVWSSGDSDTLTVDTDRATLFFLGLFAEGTLMVSRHVGIPIAVGAGILPPGLEVRFSEKSMAVLQVLVLDASVGVSILF